MHLVVDLLRESAVFEFVPESTNYYRCDCYHELTLQVLVDAFPRRSSSLDVLTDVSAVRAADGHETIAGHFAAAGDFLESHRRVLVAPAA
jgi:hypothetical protein